MGGDVDATIPPELLNKARKAEVIGFLRALPILPSRKRQLLARWGFITGAVVSAEELAYVQVIDRK